VRRPTPADSNERRAVIRAAAAIAVEAADRLNAMIVMYATAKGVPEDLVVAYLADMEPPLPNILHGYAVVVTNLLLARLAGDDDTHLPPLMPN